MLERERGASGRVLTLVQIFLGDAPAGGVEYKSSYAVAFVLFVITLGLTLFGNTILRRFREEYD